MLAVPQEAANYERRVLYTTLLRGYIIMWLRIIVAVLAVTFGSLLAASDDPVMSGVGTEVIGIAITVAVVDALFEFRRKQVEARSLARRILSQLDYTVWVWQGGRRESSIDELMALLRVNDDNWEIADSTSELIFSLGCEAQIALELHADIVQVSKDLRVGLEALKRLVPMRDRDDRPTESAIRTYLQTAASKLARAAGVETIWVSSNPTIRLRDPLPDEQFRRRFGQLASAGAVLAPSALQGLRFYPLSTAESEKGT
jgi:hypothetical protein